MMDERLKGRAFSAGLRWGGGCPRGVRGPPTHAGFNASK